MSGSFAFEVSAPDLLAAVDLQTRLEATAQTQVVSAPDGSSVLVSVPRGAVRNVLSSLAVWLEAYGLPRVELRVNRRAFTVQGRPGGGLKWRDVGGAELDDVEIGGCT
jgi:hypothetical protein